MQNSNNSKKKLRRIVQSLTSTIFLVILINNILFDINISAVPPISLIGICPIGGVTSIYDFLFISSSISLITISIVILSFLFGSVFCGWFCPMGTIQDIISSFTKKMHVKKYNGFIASKPDKYLRLIRYIMLILLILFAVKDIAHYSRLYCINNFLTGLFTGNYAVGGLVILGLIFIACSFWIERPWCKYLCPYGALLGLTNKFRMFKIKRNKSHCTNCRKCDNLCSMNIKISDNEIVNDTQCISCFECTSENNCPIENTVVIKNDYIKSIIHVKSMAFVVSAFIIVFLSVAFSYYYSLKEWSYASINPDNRDEFFITDISQNKDIKNLESDSIYNDGTYEGLAVAYRPGLKVSVTIKNNIITNIEIIAHRETRGYYEESFDKIPKLIIDKQSTNVDTITGATKTCDGIKKAVENALKKAEK